MPESHHAEIACSKLFAGVSPDAIERLLELCSVISIDAGTVLIEREQHNETVYVVLQGLLDVHLTGPKEPSFVSLGAGDCVGEMSIIEERETSAHVVACAATRLLAIPRDVMWSLIHSSHALARNMLLMLSGRLRYGNEAFRNSSHLQIEFESMAFVDGLTGLHNRR